VKARLEKRARPAPAEELRRLRAENARLKRELACDLGPECATEYLRLQDREGDVLTITEDRAYALLAIGDDPDGSQSFILTPRRALRIAQVLRAWAKARIP
jgi:hypothetical protein